MNNYSINKIRNILFLVITLSLATFVIAQYDEETASSPSPAPTTSPSPSPASTESPSPSPPTSLNETNETTCSGEASIIISASRHKDFNEEDNPEKIKENIKSAVKEITEKAETQQIKDFKACKYPPDFSCPENDCNVIFSNIYWATISPDTATESGGEISCEKEGTIEKFIPLTSPINSAIDAALEELDKIADDVSKNCLCPEGSARQIAIIILGIEIKFGIKFINGIPIPGWYIKVKYLVLVRCVKLTEEPKGATIYLNVKLTKRCVPKTTSSSG